MISRNFILSTSLLLLAASGDAYAIPVKTEMMKPRAYFVESNNGLLEALDLKAKTLTFSKKDKEQCGLNLVRRGHTLSYSCTLDIPTEAKISKLQNQVTSKSTDVAFGGSKREVTTAISPDGRSITFSTSFDSTGIDFEVNKFNDDFFVVYNKVAQIVISDAMTKQPVRIEILETR